MKMFLLLNILTVHALAAPQIDSFFIKVDDRKIEVNAPKKRTTIFSVIVENKSLTDQVAKFVAGSETLKFINVPSGKTESIELFNKTNKNVFFVPVSPAFQEIELVFGKKAYEIPSKE